MLDDTTFTASAEIPFIAHFASPSEIEFYNAHLDALDRERDQADGIEADADFVARMEALDNLIERPSQPTPFMVEFSTLIRQFAAVQFATTMACFDAAVKIAGAK